MSFFSSFFKDAGQKAGEILGDQASKNMHTATAEVIKGMDAFRGKAASPVVKNADYSTGRGFLFEYIETAKFNRDAAVKGFTFDNRNAIRYYYRFSFQRKFRSKICLQKHFFWIIYRFNFIINIFLF